MTSAGNGSQKSTPKDEETFPLGRRQSLKGSVDHARAQSVTRRAKAETAERDEPGFTLSLARSLGQVKAPSGASA